MIRRSTLDYDECFFNSQCIDGVASAYVASHFTYTTKMVPCLAGIDPVHTEFPKYQSLLYVGLSPSCHHLEKLLWNDNHVTIIVHNESVFGGLNRFRHDKNIILVLDKWRSGCGLVWEYFSRLNENLGRRESRADFELSEYRPWRSYPWLLEFIEDSLLRRFKFKDTKYVICSLCYFYPKLSINDFHTILGTDKTDIPDDWIVTGKKLWEEREKEIARYVRASTKCTHISNNVTYTVLCVTCPSHLCYDIGSELAKMADFAAIYEYHHVKDEWWIYLHSSDDCEISMVDIANKYGGGGRPNASGFAISGNGKDIDRLKDVFFPVKLEDVK